MIKPDEGRGGHAVLIPPGAQQYVAGDQKDDKGLSLAPSALVGSSFDLGASLKVHHLSGTALPGYPTLCDYVCVLSSNHIIIFL